MKLSRARAGGATTGAGLTFNSITFYSTKIMNHFILFAHGGFGGAGAFVLVLFVALILVVVALDRPRQ